MNEAEEQKKSLAKLPIYEHFIESIFNKQMFSAVYT